MELKSINVDCVGQLLKLILHQNHINQLNLYNQVSERDHMHHLITMTLSEARSGYKMFVLQDLPVLVFSLFLVGVWVYLSNLPLYRLVLWL